MAETTVVTGIKPTGSPHLGNYVGAIRPALALAERFDAFYFIADYHALNAIADAATLRRYTREVAATWLAFGLDPARIAFYRQSDVPETLELSAILANVTPKGLMNRAHAYKAATAKNLERGRDADDGVNMGLYNYPILMAADILIVSADLVPVGRDQLQHVEITRDVADGFNRSYGEVLAVPEPYLSDAPSIPGTDGRKMSKSYDNTLPLFAVTSAALRKRVRRFVTDSTPADAPKDADSAALYQVYRQVAAPADARRAREALAAGEMGWGELKQLLSEALEALLSAPRARYRDLIDHPQQIDRILADGAARVRPRAAALLRRARAAVGID